MITGPFGNCKTAELQRGGHVQSFGGLVAIARSTERICACSANIAEFTGKTAEQLLSQHWSIAFDPKHLAALRQPADAPGQHLSHIERVELRGCRLLIASHTIDDVTLVEMEHDLDEDPIFDFADRVAYLQELTATTTLHSAGELLMRQVARVNQYDRVLLYRFLPEWDGEVIAETLKPGIPGYLGLRFPSTDLPANARRLYVLNWQRIIADVHSENTAVISSSECPPIDFSYSQLRAVHAVHIQYLKNIGVESSFSVSVMVGARLWGLVVCHHLSAKALSLHRRQLCEEIARMTGMHMTDLHALQVEQRRAALQEQLAAILGELRTQDGNKRSMVSQLAPIRQTFRSPGVLLHLDDQDFHGGEVPDEISLSALRNSLETADRSSVAARHLINPTLAKYPALVRFASGTLYVPLTGQDFLLLMRPEQIETVRWAGKPQEHEDAGTEVSQLTPRASFQSWSERVKGTSEMWEAAEIEAVARLRHLLIEYSDKRELESMAFRDPLTGLANRAMFEKSLQEAVRLSIKDDMLAAVFMLDLDRFKAVNDTLGHSAGDELLIQVSQRLKDVMRARDTVARLGGDEFGIVGFNLRDAQDAGAFAERIIGEIQRPFLIEGNNVGIGVSIGVSMCPIHAVEGNELLENADLALYQAKGAGRNTFKSFTNDMLSDAGQRDSVRRDLINAMQDGSLFLVYQPIVSAKTKALQSFEAFARWQHPSKGELPARDFLPLIEQCQLLAPFADWGIRQVLQQGKTWMRSALPLVPVSLNLYAKQFLNIDLVSLCGLISKELDIGLEWLRFDLEETTLNTDSSRAAQKIAALSELGVMINVDHFGQGLVPLNRICEVKLNSLKTLGRYFDNGHDSSRHDALVAIIREVGRVLHLPIVATRIENEAMMHRAVNAGMAFLQGDFISMPLPATAATVLLRGRIAKEKSRSSE